jgi:hypothetical protein
MTAIEVHTLPLRSVALQLGAAVTLVAATLAGLDQAGTASQVLLGVAVLLAATLALAVDEPGAEVLDATATPFAVRVAHRVLLLCAVAAPLWLLALAVVALRGADVPVRMLSLQALTLVALGVAVAAALRRWRRMAEPGLVAGPVLVGFLVAAYQLPRSLTLMPLHPGDPSWHAAQLRWTAVLLVALAVLLIGLSDPATASGLRRPRRRA